MPSSADCAEHRDHGAPLSGPFIVLLLALVSSGAAGLTAALTAVAIMCIQVQIPAWWATVIGISGRHVGVVSALGNSMGVAGAFTSPLFMGAISDELTRRGYVGRDAWDPGLYPFIGVMFLASVFWFCTRPGRPIERE